jgi:hypothetical protein
MLFNRVRNDRGAQIDGGLLSTALLICAWLVLCVWAVRILSGLGVLESNRSGSEDRSAEKRSEPATP